MTIDSDKILHDLLNSLDSLEGIRPGEIPNIALYMDQVTTFMDAQLASSRRFESDKVLTKTMINNYAKNKLLPPPVKKKYSRVHLASLIIICILKQSLSISDIQRMFPQDHSEEAIHKLYDDFVEQYRKVFGAFARQIQATDEVLIEGGSALITSAAVISSLSKDLTEFLLGCGETADRTEKA